MLLAHGIGGRQDLPIPFSAALIGAILALLVSFVALGALWTEPRLGGDLRRPRPLASLVQGMVSARAWPWFWRVAGLVAAAYFCVGLLFGPDRVENPTAGVFYVLFWVGLVPLSLLFGPVWPALNPLRTLHLLACRGLGRDPGTGLRPLPEGLGYWPAAAGLLAFVWLELVAPERATLPVIGAWLAVYVVFMLGGAVLFGSRWFDHADAFEVYSTLVGRLAPVVRGPDGVVTWRNSLDGMAGLRPVPGLTVLVVVLLGSTMYDSLSNAPIWVRFVQESSVPAPVMGDGGPAHRHRAGPRGVPWRDLAGRPVGRGGAGDDGGRARPRGGSRSPSGTWSPTTTRSCSWKASGPSPCSPTRWAPVPTGWAPRGGPSRRSVPPPPGSPCSR
ncbi:hypothetical protein [Streptosporangium vulgare]|uniref:hypothetical protein n=1 Tax=Streptosporangium vulgare TaxID=46190 RepID=UPI0031CF8617